MEIMQNHMPASHYEFERFPSGHASLDALRADAVSQEDIVRIVKICNQQQVLQWVTGARVGSDGTYGVQSAMTFIDFGENGWSTNDHFVYVIRNAEQVIEGAIDIKSSDRSSAEIGYWSNTEGEGGYMTNATLALSSIAKDAGYQSLYAFVRPENERSVKVLERSGFVFASNEQDEKGPVLRFEKSLV